MLPGIQKLLIGLLEKMLPSKVAADGTTESKHVQVKLMDNILHLKAPLFCPDFEGSMYLSCCIQHPVSCHILATIKIVNNSICKRWCSI